jgi:hypothetical protein
VNTLNINDLVMMVKVIDLSCEKGVFKGADMKPIGDLRERLVDFIKHVESTSKEKTNEPDSQPTE